MWFSRLTSNIAKPAPPDTARRSSIPMAPRGAEAPRAAHVSYGQLPRRSDYSTDQWCRSAHTAAYTGLMSGFVCATAPSHSARPSVSSAIGIQPLYQPHFDATTGTREHRRVTHRPAGVLMSVEDAVSTSRPCANNVSTSPRKTPSRCAPM